MIDTFDDDALPAVSADEPCGPDLDAAGDSEFMNFIAALEGQMPAAYFSFDRKTIDFDAAFAGAARLMTRTHDLRLIVLIAKLAILNRDLAAFVHWVCAIAWLLTRHWEDVHPRAEEGDYSARLAQLATLDDAPVVAFPLQYAPLVETQRDGALTYRAVMVANGEAKPRDGETLASPGAIERIASSAAIESLAGAYGALQRLRSAMDTITTETGQRASVERGVDFTVLAPLVDKMIAYLQSALVKRDPALAPSSAAPDEQAPEGALAFRSLADVDAALAAALGYFSLNEPSSPALLLIGQARATLGKNLYEVMRLLAPQYAEKARVFVGPDGAFTVPVRNLSEPSQTDRAPGEAPAAASRGEAFGLIDKAAAHLRRVEPSSPAPYLLDRAHALASRDFLSLLGEVLPADDLEAMKRGH